MLLFFYCAQSEAASVVNIVYTGDAGQVTPYVKALQTADTEIKTTNLAIDSLSPADLYISAGSDALRVLIEKKTRTPILATQISKINYETLVNSRSNISAIFAEPDPTKQIKLISLLYPHNSRVVALVSKQSIFLEDQLKAAGKEYDVEVIIEKIDNIKDISKTLAGLTSVNAVLAIPDTTIYNSDTLRTILLTTYRHNQALIGFSPGMVRAGALATITYSMEQIMDEARKWIYEFQHSTVLPPPRYPSQYDLILNERVMSSLNVSSETKTTLITKLKRIGNK